MPLRIPWPVKPPAGWPLNPLAPSAAALAGLWPLWENAGAIARDIASGGGATTGNPLTLNGAVAWVPGPDGPALSLPGANTSYLQTVGPVLNPFLSDFTLALWFNVTAGAAVQQDLVQQLDGTKSIGGTGTGRTWLYLSTGGSGTAVLESFLGGANTVGFTPVTAGVWHHAAVSCQGSLISLYLDGHLEASSTHAPEDNAAELRFGNGKSAGSGAFTGLIGRSAATLWRRALGAAEVIQLASDPYRLWLPRRAWAQYAGSVPTTGGPWPWFLDNALTGGFSSMGL